MAVQKVQVLHSGTYALHRLYIKGVTEILILSHTETDIVPQCLRLPIFYCLHNGESLCTNSGVETSICIDQNQNRIVLFFS